MQNQAPIGASLRHGRWTHLNVNAWVEEPKKYNHLKWILIGVVLKDPKTNVKNGQGKTWFSSDNEVYSKKKGALEHRARGLVSNNGFHPTLKVTQTTHNRLGLVIVNSNTVGLGALVSTYDQSKPLILPTPIKIQPELANNHLLFDKTVLSLHQFQSHGYGCKCRSLTAVQGVRLGRRK